MALSKPTSARAAMKKELHRLATYTEWPARRHVYPSALARLGFFNSDDTDRVVCFCCGIAISEWHDGDNPEVKHRQYSPQCPVVIGNNSGNVPMQILGEDFVQRMQTEASSRPLTGPDAMDFVGAEPVNSNSTFLTIYRGASERANRRGVFRHSNAAAPVDPENPDFEQLRREKVRFSTFTNWPARSPLKPVDLARAGFFYMGMSDRVKCIFCGGILKNWADNDEPLAEHRKHYPDCPFVKGSDVGNVASQDDVVGNYTPTSIKLPRETFQSDRADNTMLVDAGIAGPQQTFESLRRATTLPAKHPEFASAEARQQTFLVSGVTLPRGQDIDVLVEAGFYHVGPHDNVKCFCCDVGLKNWQGGDRPWAEHARWQPQCAYLRQKKDASFIEAAQNERRSWLAENRSAPSTDAGLLAPTSASLLERSSITVIPASSSSTALSAVADSDTPPAADTVSDAATAADSATAARPKSRKNKKKQATAEMSANAEEPVGTSEADKDVDENDEEAKSLLAENQQLKEARTCKVCMDSEVNVVFLPCGHLVCCDSCAPALRSCAVCRTLIRGTVKIFLPDE